jgi:hypothetical protein
MPKDQYAKGQVQTPDAANQGAPGVKFPSSRTAWVRHERANPGLGNGKDGQTNDPKANRNKTVG